MARPTKDEHDFLEHVENAKMSVTSAVDRAGQVAARIRFIEKLVSGRTLDAVRPTQMILGELIDLLVDANGNLQELIDRLQEQRNRK